MRWGTVSLSVSFQASAHGTDLLATATVTRRARTLCFLSVAVEDPDHAVVAHGLVTYRLG
jgi:acyl-coenzyme A thioesterase PaaI-like protein